MSLGAEPTSGAGGAVADPQGQVQRASHMQQQRAVLASLAVDPGKPSVYTVVSCLQHSHSVIRLAYSI